MSSLIQRSFAGGEVAPSLYARTDLVKYATGARTLRNMMVMRHGGAQNRPGTTFVGEVKDSTKTIRFIPFIFNASQTYVLEFGDQYMRVHQNGAQVTESPKTITGVTRANPAVVTAVGHGFSTGDEVFISGVVGMTTLNGRNFKIVSLTADTFSLKYMDGTVVNSTAFTAWSSGGTAARIYTISTPYVAADLPLLKYVQSADVITIAHPSYAPRELARTGSTSWTLTVITFAPGIAAPTSPTPQTGTATLWKITAVAQETLEESLPSATAGSSAVPSGGSPITVGWAAVSGAQEYNVYKNVNGVYGFIGTAVGTSFSDVGVTPDTSDTPPITRNPFPGAGDFPSTVAYYQQRLMFGNTNNNPESVYGSKSANFKNFTISSPLQADDAITFTLVGRQVNAVKHLIDLGVLLAFTSGAEQSITGDPSGILRPGQIYPKTHSYNGTSDLAPIILDGSALYVQARGSIVRDIGFDFQIDGYRGNDLTVFSSHLFDKYTLADWAIQKIPQPIVWAVRSDGTLLGLTYLKDQQILAWHRHDLSGGTVENICIVPEGTEDAVYLLVKRTINGATKRYVERMASRKVVDVIDSIFMDAALSYDGRNAGATTMALSGGTTWVYTETLTLTASAGFFAATDVGNIIQLTGADGELIRFTIAGYTSTTVVTGKANRTVPASLRSTAVTTWAKAVAVVGGLWHLEGKEVSVMGDRFVVASPNNAANVVVTVASGSVTLDKPYSVIHVGLPYISDLETLDIDTPQGETVSDKKKLISKVSAFLEESRGMWSGARPPTDDTLDPLENLNELKIRNEEAYDDPVALQTGTVDIIIAGDWNSNGRVFVRQVDPLPISVLAIVPAGLVPFRS